MVERSPQILGSEEKATTTTFNTALTETASEILGNTTGRRNPGSLQIFLINATVALFLFTNGRGKSRAVALRFTKTYLPGSGVWVHQNLPTGAFS